MEAPRRRGGGACAQDWNDTSSFLTKRDERHGMGPRVADHLSSPTDDDIKAMHMVVKQAIEAGALGVGSNRGGGHSDLSGNPVPGSFAPIREIEALAELSLEEAL